MPLTSRVVEPGHPEVSLRSSLVPAFAAAALSFGTPASAADSTMWGGETASEGGFHFEAGFPSLGFGYRIPVSDKFELMPNARFHYMRWLAVNLGASVGVEGRLQLLDGDKLNGALTFSLPLQLIFGDGAIFAVGLLYPGYMLDYAVSDTMSMVFGLRIEDDLFIGGGALFFATIPLIVGFEAEVEGLKLGFKIEGGPAFITLGGSTFLSGEVRALFGIDI